LRYFTANTGKRCHLTNCTSETCVKEFAIFLKNGCKKQDKCPAGLGANY
jgi:hypothetical protein